MCANFLPDYSIKPGLCQCQVPYDFLIAIAVVQASPYKSQRINISHSKSSAGTEVFESSEKLWFCIFLYLNVSFKLSPDIHAFQAFSEKYLSIPGLLVNKQSLIPCNHIKQTLSFAEQHNVGLYQPFCLLQKGRCGCC